MNTPTYCEECGEKRPGEQAIRIYCPKHLKEHTPQTTPDTEWEGEIRDELKEQLYTMLKVTSQMQPKSDVEFIATALPNLHIWAFHYIKSLLYSRDTYWKERVIEIVGFIDKEFLATPDCEEYPAEWAINKDRQRIIQALDNLK